MSSVTALIAAAGSGERLGLGPKAFVRVGGLTLLELAVTAVRGAATEIVVAVPAEHLGPARQLAPEATIISGGTDRQATVRAMLAASHGDVVLVHDVARPFVTPAVLRRVLAAVEATGAATAALAPADTVIMAEHGDVVQRELLRLVQTPQGFHRSLLAEAHEAAAQAGVSATDDAALVRRLGRAVALVEGSPLLSKLTVAGDLPLFEALHAVWLKETRAVQRAAR